MFKVLWWRSRCTNPNLGTSRPTFSVLRPERFLMQVLALVQSRQVPSHKHMRKWFGLHPRGSMNPAGSSKVYKIGQNCKLKLFDIHTNICSETHHNMSVDNPGRFSHWHGIRICACVLGRFFAKFGIRIGGFSSETKEPKLKNWVYFEQITVNSTQFEQNWVLSIENGILMGR